MFICYNMKCVEVRRFWIFVKASFQGWPPSFLIEGPRDPPLDVRGTSPGIPKKARNPQDTPWDSPRRSQGTPQGHPGTPQGAQGTSQDLPKDPRDTRGNPKVPPGTPRCSQAPPPERPRAVHAAFVEFRFKNRPAATSHQPVASSQQPATSS